MYRSCRYLEISLAENAIGRSRRCYDILLLLFAVDSFVLNVTVEARIH